MQNLYIVVFLILFALLVNLLLTVKPSDDNDKNTEHFNGVLFIKNHASTFPLSPDFNIDNQITAKHYMSPYIGWKRIWRQNYSREDPALLRLEQPDFKQDASTYF